VVNDPEPSAVVPITDLTFCEAGRIHSGYMPLDMGRAPNAGQSQNPAPIQSVTRAALYARVSDPHSAKEGTIDMVPHVAARKTHQRL